MNVSLIMSSLALLAVLAIACGAAPNPSVATIIPGPAPLPAGSTPAITNYAITVNGGTWWE